VIAMGYTDRTAGARTRLDDHVGMAGNELADVIDHQPSVETERGAETGGHHDRNGLAAKELGFVSTRGGAARGQRCEYGERRTNSAVRHSSSPWRAFVGYPGS